MTSTETRNAVKELVAAWEAFRRTDIGGISGKTLAAFGAVDTAVSSLTKLLGEVANG